ncbi:hypothetical protein Dda_7108 [Drechslerella dactyloides]|uniref:Uncharacterized protein n=1 Tax=Drechslerella dactyloides TaxID=74499 RepID=A0AAD6NH84_DREDA|nr:hypothetical protein Dda_7108 [Drechslerella dactyloides]
MAFLLSPQTSEAESAYNSDSPLPTSGLPSVTDSDSDTPCSAEYRESTNPFKCENKSPGAKICQTLHHKTGRRTSRLTGNQNNMQNNHKGSE